MNINITTEKLQKVLDSGLTFSGWIAINLIKNGETEFLKKSEEDGVFLIMEGWMGASYNLTPKSLKLIETLEGSKDEPQVTNCQILYGTLKDKMIALTGKKQKLIQGKYYFMPSEKDFCDKLTKVVKKYKLSDWNKVEKVLIAYICRANKAKFEMMPLLGYFIEKNGSSQLSLEYENFVEEVEQKEEISKHKFV